jgi:hypothetical protein
VDIIVGPEFVVRPGGSDIEASTAQCVKEQRSAPTVYQLAIGIQSHMIIREKSFVGRIFSTKKVGPVFVGAEGSIGGGFEEELGIVHEPGHESKVVLWWKIGVGVVA